MITIKRINKYLEDNGKNEDIGYLLKDSGQGNFIAEWKVEGLDKPTENTLKKYDASIIVDEEMGQLKKDLDYIGLSDDIENIMDAILIFDQPMFDAISEETLDKYRMKKTLKNQ